MAFSTNYNNTIATIQTINIDMTELTWNSRVLSTSKWYDVSLRVAYKNE